MPTGDIAPRPVQLCHHLLRWLIRLLDRFARSRRFTFTFYERKPRLIATPLPEPVVHHALMNVIEPHLERRFLHDSYGCPRGQRHPL